jgi:hypothetical protein
VNTMVAGNLKKLALCGILVLLVILAGCVTQPMSTAVQTSSSPSSQPPQTKPNPVNSPFVPPTIITNSVTPIPSNNTNSVSTKPNSKPLSGTVILGRPTAESITLSLLSRDNINIYIQYGTNPGKYEFQTGFTVLQKDQPYELKIGGLKTNTQYYYRIYHQTFGEPAFSATADSTFRTQRAEGDAFVFTIDADPHWDNNTDPQKLGITFLNILGEHSDFNIDLGDTFMTEKLKARSYPEASSVYIDKRSDFNIFGASVPLYLVIGNHDGEIAGAANKIENNITVWAREARVNYYPNPNPDSFYSGNQRIDPFIGPGENYYSWEWGDALFVVLDPYWYSPGAGKLISGWNMTLGKEQYDWLKGTLEKSKAKFKFIFAHSLVGGFDLGTAGNMRGGTEAAGLFEWGGRNEDGSWGFDQNRPGWGKPIHQILVDNHVTAFFHGHDHFFGQQQLDGIIYLECPQPGAINENNHAAEFGYKTGTFVDGAGHIRVTVANDSVTLDFIRTYLPGKEPAGRKNGEIAYSYAIGS